MHQVIKAGSVDLVYSRFSNFETASLGVFLKTGARFEKKKQKGIAHFLEHMLFKGSRRYNHRKIKQEIEGRGGFLNGFTSQEMTAYYACFLKKNTLVALDILLDMVLDPSLLSSEIKKEKGVVLEEIKMYNDLPSSRAKTILDNLLWQSHPLGQDIIGSSESIKKLTRADLLKFKNDYYVPFNTLISFCGDFPLSKIKQFIEKKVKEKSKRKKIYQKKPTRQKGVKIALEKKEIQQLHLCLGFQSIPYSSDKRIIQQLLHVILGGNMSSRLFESLREKRSLCYDISTEPREYKDCGAFIIRLGLDKEKAGLALATIKKELLKIKNKEISRSELSRAKDYFLGQFSMSLEQPQGRMFYLAQSRIKCFQIESPERLKSRVESVMPSQIRDFACKVFNFKDFALAAVGDISGVSAEKIKGIFKDEKKSNGQKQ